MIDKLKPILSFSKRYYVIGVIAGHDVLEYQLIEIRYKDHELKIENRFFSNDFNDDFKAKLNKDYPIILHVEDHNIINKRVENKTGYRKNLIFKANQDDFYFFEYHQNDNVFISVTRKHHIDDLIHRFSNSELFVIHIAFGPFVMANLLPIVKDYETISSANYSLEINQNEILSFKNESIKNKVFSVNGDSVNQREMALLATFLDYQYPNAALEFDTEFLNKNKEEFKFKKWFKITGIFALVFFLTTLFGSHYLTGLYTDELHEKEALNALSQQNILKVNNLREEKQLKEKILQSSGMSSKSFMTRYVAEIGNTVPSDITLNAVNIIPPLKKIKRSKKIDFDVQAISISGESQNDLSFNSWLKALETLDWVKQMDIKDYFQESNLENSFTIRIQI